MTSGTGFSLIELAIVLVILGLLVGGILTGQSLIRSAELRSVTADLQSYNTAIYSFRDKYMALPGDMQMATRFWGVAVAGNTGNDDVCFAVSSATTATCNGNGDGWIEQGYSGNYFSERYSAWKHMANAGLIKGSYTGYGGTIATETRQPGINIPLGRIANTGFYISAMGDQPVTGHAHYFDGSYGFNSVALVGGGFAPTLRPEELWNIDLKIDDGRPGYGKIWALKSSSTWNPGCTTTDNPTTAEYSLTNSSIVCDLRSRLF